MLYLGLPTDWGCYWKSSWPRNNKPMSSKRNLALNFSNVYKLSENQEVLQLRDQWLRVGSLRNFVHNNLGSNESGKEQIQNLSAGATRGEHSHIALTQIRPDPSSPNSLSSNRGQSRAKEVLQSGRSAFSGIFDSASRKLSLLTANYAGVQLSRWLHHTTNSIPCRSIEDKAGISITNTASLQSEKLHPFDLANSSQD